MYGLNQIILALIFHALDLVSGLIGAVRQGNLQSSRLRDGMFKKVGFILCYVLALLIDTKGAEIGLSFGTKILPIIIIYAVTTEIISILENICKINPDLVPAKLKSIFQIEDVKEGE